MPVASGMTRDADSAAITIAQRHAALHATRLVPGERVRLPEAPYVHSVGFGSLGAVADVPLQDV